MLFYRRRASWRRIGVPVPPVCSNCGANDFVWANELKTGSIGGGTLSLRSRGELSMGTRICKSCGHADLFLKDPAILTTASHLETGRIRSDPWRSRVVDPPHSRRHGDTVLHARPTNAGKSIHPLPGSDPHSLDGSATPPTASPHAGRLGISFGNAGGAHAALARSGGHGDRRCQSRPKSSPAREGEDDRRQVAASVLDPPDVAVRGAAGARYVPRATGSRK